MKTAFGTAEAARQRLSFAAAALLTLPGFALAQDPVPLPAVVTHALGAPVKIRGLIVARAGDDMVVREGTGATHIVTLSAATKVQSPSGLMKMDRKVYDPSVLVPGLGVTVEGTGASQGKISATKVSFAGSALKVAEQITAGGEVVKAHQAALKTEQDSLTARQFESNRRIAANRDSIEAGKARTLDSLRRVQNRVTSLDDYDLKYTSTLSFETGRATLSSEAKAQLDLLVENATGIAGYIVQIAGYADTTGSVATNQALSTRRAEAVAQYLAQVRNVPLRRILNPTGQGASNAISTNATPEGRAMNRRVEVKVLVNRALNGRS